MRYSRQNKILDLVAQYDIETQDQLQEMLREAGYPVTQATISRDIKELQLVKALSANGRYKYVAGISANQPISERFIKIFRETIISYNSANNLILVKALSGCGPAAAEAIDCMELSHVIGSVAGDNTLLIVVDEEKNVQPIMDEFSKLLSNESEK